MAASAALVILSGSAKSDEMEVISAADALSLARSGDILLIDVRSSGEWRQTGVPAGARQVTIHDPNGLRGFLDSIKAEVGNDLNTRIALICARGNRSTIAQRVLTEAGFTNVLNVREGMFGSADGPGWLAQKLPVDDCRLC
jgi:rhodanese-related sulfurtransferase